MIKTIDLGKNFGNRILFQKVNLEIQESHMVAFCGESGCGKTTLLNMISLLDSDYVGQILIDNIDYRKDSRAKREKQRQKLFSYVFSEDYLLDYLTPKENIIYACKGVHKDLPEDFQKEVNDFGLSNLLDANIKTLSQGEKQRFSIFRALALQRKYIICDEPTAHLDHENSKKVFELLSSESKKGSTILVSLHDRSMLNYFDEAYEIENYEIRKIDLERTLS